MRRFASILLVGIGCAPTSAIPDDAATDGGSTYSCPSNLEGFPYDVAGSCFEPAAHIGGICMSIPTPSTKGLEVICVVDGNGQLYTLVVPTDASLSGAGWQFGPRIFPSLVHDGAPLTSAQTTTCADAQSKISGVTPRADAMCQADAGTD